MERLEYTMDIVNQITGNKRRRHIIGGVLLSVAMLFGGLAVTVLTIRAEENEENDQGYFLE